MTKEEWLQRCAIRFIERTGLTPKKAHELACTTFDAQDDPGFEFSESGEYNPENCADEEMSYWDE